MGLQVDLDAGRKDGATVLPTLPPAHDDKVLVEVDILNAQREALRQAHTGTVEQPDDQPSIPRKLTQDGLNLGARENDGKARLGDSPHHITQVANGTAQNLPVQKKKSG